MTMGSTGEYGQNPAWQGLVFRTMRQEDLEQAWELSQAVKWPHRLEDWRFALALGQGEAVLDGGRLIGVAMRWDFGACATMGLIIVSATHRGRQIASRLVGGALAGATAPTVLLHATPDGAGVYARQGFETDRTICQHQGPAIAVPAPVPPGCALRPATLADLDTLEMLDRRASGMSRRAVLRTLLEIGKGVIAERDGAAVGFSFLRDFGRGEVIGPVVAPVAELAKVLVAHWLGIRAGAFIRVDTPLEEELGDWLAAAGLAKVDTVTRMMRGPALAQDAQMHTYGLVTQAMG